MFAAVVHPVLLIVHFKESDRDVIKIVLRRPDFIIICIILENCSLTYVSLIYKFIFIDPASCTILIKAEYLFFHFKH